MKAKILLSVTTRKYCSKTVDVPNDFESWNQYEKDEFMNKVFTKTVEDGYDDQWIDDIDWGYEEGKHHIVKMIA